MMGAGGLALKDHGRARTLQGLRDGDDGDLAAQLPAMMTLQGPSPAMVLQGQAPLTIAGRTHSSRTIARAIMM